MAKKMDKMEGMPKQEQIPDNIAYAVLLYQNEDGSVSFAQKITVGDKVFNVGEIPLEHLHNTLSQGLFTLQKAYVQAFASGEVNVGDEVQ